MYEALENSPTAIPPQPPTPPEPPAKPPSAFALFPLWVLPHIILLSPGFIWWAWQITVSPLSPGACLGLPFIIGGAFIAQALGAATLFKKLNQYLLWNAAFALGFVIMFFTFFGAVMGGSKAFQTPWGITVIGGVFGAIEAFVLFSRYKRAWWWIAANAAGLSVGVYVTTALLDAVPDCNPSVAACSLAPFIMPIVAGLAAFSLITGAILVWITRSTISKPFTRSAQIQAGAAALLILLAFLLFNTYAASPRQQAEQATKHAESIFFSDLDMASPQEGWAVGGAFDERRNGVMFHYTNGAWAEETAPAAKSISQLDSVSMVSDTEGWATGSESTLLHYTNGIWTRVDPPAGLSRGASILSLEMLSPNNGWAIAQDYNPQNPDLQNVLLHYDGTQWQYVRPKLPANSILTHLSFSTPDDGWAVGFTSTSKGAVSLMVKYTNGTWQYVESNMPDIPTAIQMLSPDEGWALVSNHTVGTHIYHYTGGEWTQSAFFPDLILPSLNIISPHEAYAVGSIDQGGPPVHAQAHYDGTKWTKTAEEAMIPSVGLLDMISEDEGWAIGSTAPYHYVFYHYKNKTWTPTP